MYARWLRREWRRGKFLAFVATGNEGQILGSGGIWLMPTHPRLQRYTPELPYILSMYTERRARRRGVATAILRACIDWATRHRYPRIILHASEMGRPVYERLGFEASREMRLNLPTRRRRVRATNARARRKGPTSPVAKTR